LADHPLNLAVLRRRMISLSGKNLTAARASESLHQPPTNKYLPVTPSFFVDSDQGLTYSFGIGPSSFDRCPSSPAHAP
jgi:hypothetical protein